MAIIVSPPQRLCLYCGLPATGVRKGEHVIPESLGGTQTIRNVCNKCNTDFSLLDNELASRSPLQVLVQQNLDQRCGYVWSYNRIHNVAAEAYILRDCVAPCLWPQLVFLGEKTVFMFDMHEAQQAGIENFTAGFSKCLQAARARIRLERVPEPPNRGWYPPRIFTPHHYREFTTKITFTCRYSGMCDRDKVAYWLHRWICRPSRGRFDTELGVRDPEFCLSYNPSRIMRDLVKIGLNTICYVFRNAVDRRQFATAAMYVRGEHGMELSPQDNGFLEQASISWMGCPSDSHRIFLLWNGSWRVVFGFFGGQLGATVSFPGPQVCGCHSIEVTAPVNKGQWIVRKSRIIIRPRKGNVTWSDLNLMFPSTRITNAAASFHPR